MASKGKMNKAQLHARVQDLEQELELKVKNIKAIGDELEVARSIADLCNATNADNNKFREENKKLKEEKMILQYKVELFEKHTTEPRTMIYPTVFADFLSEENEQIYEGGDCHILEGFHWEMVKDGETNEEHLQLVKNKVSQIKKWEESGDANPQLLLNAIAEKLGLKPIDWGQEGADEQSYELWDKIADTMNEP